MNSNRWQQIEEICHAALDCPEEQRASFLQTACAGDSAMLREVTKLIENEDVLPVFLMSPPFGLTVKAISERALADGPAEEELGPLNGQVISHYRILDRIGEGGMGVVYKAEDIELDRFVALKFLSTKPWRRASWSPSTEEKAIDQVRREARVSSALDHPNICTIYEVGQCAGRPFMAMQFLRGRTLKQLIDGKPLPIAEVVRLGMQIADGLEAAHRQGIIHRDIKSANLFITERGDAKILDFGLAKLQQDRLEVSETDELPSISQVKTEHTLTRPGMVAGTVAYMSPEQVMNKDLDVRTDLFSFGVMLYEMSTGVLPFQGSNSSQVRDGILHQEPIRVSRLNPSAPAGLESAIAKALEKNRESRYHSAAELRADLARIQPLDAAAHGRRKRRARIVTTVVLLAFGAAGLVGYRFLGRKAQRLGAHDTVVLTDFSNSTGDAVFDDTLKQALRVQLEQSPFLNVLSDEKTSQVLRYMGLSSDAPLVGNVAREVCLRTGSKAMLSGSVSQFGGHYVLGLNAAGCETGDLLASEQIETDSREKVLAALGKAGTQLREKLGESMASIRQYDSPVEQATTSSLEALQAYNLGLKTRYTHGDEAAVPYFNKAISLDPKFAMAYARLGSAYFDLYQLENASAMTRKAYDLRERVSQREKLYIESHYYDSATGELYKAEQAYRLWQQVYPRDFIPYADLAIVYGFLGRHPEALVQQLQAIRLDPDNGAVYENAGTEYVNLNQFDKAKEMIAQAKLRNAESTLFLSLRYQLAFLENDQQEMERQVRFAAGKTGFEDLLLAQQADTEAYYGRLEQAREYTRRAIQSARSNGNAETARGYAIVAALREAQVGNLERAKEVARKASSPTDRTTGVLSALCFALTGDHAHALASAQAIRRRFTGDTLVNDYWLPIIEATIELNRRHTAAAIEYLRPGIPLDLAAPQSPTNTVGYSMYLRGLSYLAAGRGAEAAIQFEEIEKHHGLFSNSLLRALAWVQLGRAYSMTRQGDRAREAYSRFLILWKDADPNIPILRQAKAEYTRLSSGN
jgi:tetratricopeptide (TPR) repeat protein/tRNA A-37 threonylcarbamoyl transferase component Bud32